MKNLIKQSITTGCVAMLAFALSIGCGQKKNEDGGDARVIDTKGTETITTVGNIDIQDANNAATELSQKMIAQGFLGKGGKPSLIVLDRYKNDSGVHLDRDQILKTIRINLLKSKLANFSTVVNSKGGMEGESVHASKIAKRDSEAEKIDAWAEGSDEAPKTAAEFVGADYSMTLTILRNRVRAGNVRQNTFIFQMSVVNLRSRAKETVFEDQVQITKQGSRNSVGW